MSSKSLVWAAYDWNCIFAVARRRTTFWNSSISTVPDLFVSNLCVQQHHLTAGLVLCSVRVHLEDLSEALLDVVRHHEINFNLALCMSSARDKFCDSFQTDPARCIVTLALIFIDRCFGLLQHC